VTFIQPQELEVLARPFFIATEGMGDARLIDKLLQFRGIADCGVGCPSQKSAKGKTGKDAFPDYLLTVQIAKARAESVPLRGLLVVADADANAVSAFASIQAAMTNAKFPVPKRPFSIEGDPFRVGVYLLPGNGRTGTLEHLLLDAALAKFPKLQQCLDDFSACTGALRSAKPNQLAKMQMSALAAAFCEDNPWCSPNLMLCDRNNPSPIDSECFSDVCDFLGRFIA
jgi:hypothetical protein